MQNQFVSPPLRKLLTLNIFTQVYTPYGKFLRKFGAEALLHPRGVCCDERGRIIVVECRVMRVIIFEAPPHDGRILNKFSCARHLEFPNGVAASAEREEIFISDNRAHCAKVFNYRGQYLRQIGGEGLTNFPIGVCLTSSLAALQGDVPAAALQAAAAVGPNGVRQQYVVVADNHNNFNITIFRASDGSLVGAYESKVKHSQCFDVALVDDGYVVLASKDYRIYVYRYGSGSASPSAAAGAHNHRATTPSTPLSAPPMPPNRDMGSLLAASALARQYSSS